MKVLIVLTVLMVTIFASAKASSRGFNGGRGAGQFSDSASSWDMVSKAYCSKDVQTECCEGACQVNVRLENCNATYGKFGSVKSRLEQYANALIDTSYKYLTVSSYFGNFEKNRLGLKKLYRKLSDEAWDDAKDLINFITLRGGKMDFTNRPPYLERSVAKVNEGNLAELERMSNILDNYKMLAGKAMEIQSHVVRHSDADGSVAHYFEERFFNRQTKTVHTLAGYVNDMKQFFSSMDASLALFLFDEYLQKSV